jgi:hypothetical protein
VQTRRLVAFGLAALVVASCGGNEKSAATVPAVVITTTVADTTAPTTAATASSTSTTAAVAETTTLPATTTTVATEDLIKQAVQAYIGEYFTCGQTPSTCDPSTFTATQGQSREKITQLIIGMNGAGLHFSTDLRGSYLTAESIGQNSDVFASAIYCAYDALTVLGPNGPDGLPTVVNDAISNVRYMYSLFFEDGRWVVGQQDQVERLGEGELCPAT